MARYDFACPKCQQVVEIERSVRDELVPPLCCAEGCDGIEMFQVISASAFILKGGGWAAQGYSKGGPK